MHSIEPCTEVHPFLEKGAPKMAEVQIKEGGCSPSSVSITTATNYQNCSAFRKAERYYKWSRVPQCTALGKQLKKLAHNVNEVDLTDVIDVRAPSRNTAENNALMRRIDLPPPASSSSSSSSSPHIPPTKTNVTSICTSSSPAAAAQPIDYCLTCTAIPGLYIFPSCISTEDEVALCREAILTYGNSTNFDNMLSTHVKSPHETRCYRPPMRWATLGFDYQWTSKSYKKDSFSLFPPLVKTIMMRLAERVFQAEELDTQVPLSEKKSQPSIYQPQSGIVNYFPVGTSMMAHQDAAEEALTQPLLSLSLGASCIFLMGTTSMMDAPRAFLLRSGDLVAFAGPSRLCYHSVSRILNDTPSYLTVAEEMLSEREKKRYRQYCYYHHWDHEKYQVITGDAKDNGKDGLAPLRNSMEQGRSHDTKHDNEEGGRAVTAVQVENQTNKKQNGTATRSQKDSSGMQNHNKGKTMYDDSSMIDPSTMSEEERERYWKLCMRHMRININARQVYCEPCDFLFSEKR